MNNIYKLLQVYYGEVDVGIGMVNYHYQRAQDIDYTSPVYELSYRFAQRLPVVLPYYSNITQPFTVIVWYLILGSLAATTLCYVIISRERMKLAFVPSAMLVGQAVTLYRNPKALLFLTIFWIFASTIIFHAFRENLLANLAVVNREKPADSIQAGISRVIWIMKQKSCLIRSYEHRSDVKVY